MRRRKRAILRPIVVLCLAPLLGFLLGHFLKWLLSIGLHYMPPVRVFLSRRLCQCNWMQERIISTMSKIPIISDFDRNENVDQPSMHSRERILRDLPRKIWLDCYALIWRHWQCQRIWLLDGNQEKACTCNDDVQRTAAVELASLLVSNRMIGFREIIVWAYVSVQLCRWSGNWYCWFDRPCNTHRV